MIHKDILINKEKNLTMKILLNTRKQWKMDTKEEERRKCTERCGGGGTFNMGKRYVRVGVMVMLVLGLTERSGLGPGSGLVLGLVLGLGSGLVSGSHSGLVTFIMATSTA